MASVMIATFRVPASLNSTTFAVSGLSARISNDPSPGIVQFSDVSTSVNTYIFAASSPRGRTTNDGEASLRLKSWMNPEPSSASINSQADQRSLPQSERVNG